MRMSFAEVMLRIGCSLVGYLVLYAHCLWVAALSGAACTGDGATSWLSVLVLVPVTLGCVAVVPLGTVIPGIASTLRLPALPLVLLIGVAAVALWPAFQAHTLARIPICAIADAASGAPQTGGAAWHVLWAPVQYATLGAMAWLAVRMLRGTGTAA